MSCNAERERFLAQRVVSRTCSVIYAQSLSDMEMMPDIRTHPDFRRAPAAREHDQVLYSMAGYPPNPGKLEPACAAPL